MKSVVVLVMLVLPVTVFAGQYYKCKDVTGAMTFQSKPCPSNSKQAVQSYAKKAVSSNSQCLLHCDSVYRICLANQEGGVYNTDGGTQLCQQEKKVCYITCDDPGKAKKLEKEVDRKRTLYEKNKNRKKKKTSTKKTLTKTCRKMTRSAAREKAIKHLGYFDYDDLSKHQKERVHKRAKDYLAQECSN